MELRDEIDIYEDEKGKRYQELERIQKKIKENYISIAGEDKDALDKYYSLSKEEQKDYWPEEYHNRVFLGLINKYLQVKKKGSEIEDSGEAHKKSNYGNLTKGELFQKDLEESEYQITSWSRMPVDKVIYKYNLLRKRYKIDEFNSNMDYDIRHANEAIEKIDKGIQEDNLKIDIRTGKREPKTLNEIAILVNASDDNTYTRRPPVDGPSKKDQYYYWRGTLAKKDGGTYIVWDARVNPFTRAINQSEWGETFGHANEIDTNGFCFKDIEKRYGEMQISEPVWVVGKYGSNRDLELANGQTVTVPVLTDCYIAAR